MLTFKVTLLTVAIGLLIYLARFVFLNNSKIELQALMNTQRNLVEKEKHFLEVYNGRIPPKTRYEKKLIRLTQDAFHLEMIAFWGNKGDDDFAQQRKEIYYRWKAQQREKFKTIRETAPSPSDADWKVKYSKSASYAEAS